MAPHIMLIPFWGVYYVLSHLGFRSDSKSASPEYIGSVEGPEAEAIARKRAEFIKTHKMIPKPCSPKKRKR